MAAAPAGRTTSSARCRALLAGWDLADDAAGHYAFNDVHAVLAMLGAGDVARAEAWVARCAERALAADDARRSNHGMAREVGLPLMRGLLAFARGDADGAADALYACARRRSVSAAATRSATSSTRRCWPPPPPARATAWAAR